MGTDPTCWDRRDKTKLAQEIIEKAIEEPPFEDQNIEFKEVFFGEKREMAEVVCQEICGMLNAKEGGVIFCGVKDNGKITGIDSDSYLLKEKEFCDKKTFEDKVDWLDRKVGQYIDKKISFFGMDDMVLDPDWMSLKFEDNPEGIVLRIHVKALPNTNTIAYFEGGAGGKLVAKFFIRKKESNEPFYKQREFKNKLWRIKPSVAHVEPLTKTNEEERMKDGFGRLEDAIGKYLAAQDKWAEINDELKRVENKLPVPQEWKKDANRNKLIMSMAKEQIISIWKEEGFAEWLQQKHPHRYQEWKEMDKLRSLLSPTGGIPNVGELEGDDENVYSKYVGEIRDGKAHGLGKWFIDGAQGDIKVEGQFVNGIVMGMVEVTCGDDYVFRGYVMDGKTAGHVYEFESFGPLEIYYGGMENGRPDGHGFIAGDRSWEFKGEWEDGCPLEGSLYVASLDKEFNIKRTMSRHEWEVQFSEEELKAWDAKDVDVFSELNDGFQKNKYKQYELKLIYLEGKSKVFKKIFSLD